MTESFASNNLLMGERSSVSHGKKGQDDLYLQNYGREFGGKLTYSVGLTYGLGMFLGGSYGALLGLQKGGATPKLVLNSVMNSVGSKGPALANQCAIITMFYCGFNPFIGWMRGEDDQFNAISAGFLSGGLFKVTTSWKAAGRYGAASCVAFTAIDQGFRAGML
eukprot:GEMP01061014.1.p1 GENE.GEMP01061014.1~~GEMP01061014.1.p1  ORF type:complete len:164 (+),score=31.12 GEMP01061014.1:191-682(+)